VREEIVDAKTIMLLLWLADRAGISRRP